MRLFTYQMPDEIISIANKGEYSEFDLNSFFEASGQGGDAKFKNKDDVQKWLEIIRGQHIPTQIDSMKMGTRPPFPYSDSRLLPTFNTRLVSPKCFIVLCNEKLIKRTKQCFSASI